MVQTGIRLFDFQKPEGLENWFSINDGVMGGVSSGGIRWTPEGAAFSGKVSLDHFGGFSSVRSAAEKRDLSAYSGLLIRLRGDGKTYQLRVRTDPNYDGVTYCINFDTLNGRWQEVYFPFNKFVPEFRGQRIPFFPRIKPEKIFSFGFLIAGKQAGPFNLLIEWIDTYFEEA